MYTNLVFEGGGAKGIAFCGAIKALEEKNIMENIKGIIGSSAGAIIAGALAVGYNSIEIQKILEETSFTNFKDDSFGIFVDIYRLFKHFGLYKGQTFYDWYGKILKHKCDNKDITFEEIYKNYNINLVITGTNVNKKKVIYFNHNDYPNMPIRLAIRISMSLPFAFKPVKFNKCYYVDGGVLDNYPIWYFKDKDNTIGFKLVNSNEKRDDQIYHDNDKITNIKQFGKNIINSLTEQIERLHIKDDYWNKTITINCLGVKTTEFNIPKNTKLKLVEEGYKATTDFLNSKT